MLCKGNIWLTGFVALILGCGPVEASTNEPEQYVTIKVPAKVASQLVVEHSPNVDLCNRIKDNRHGKLLDLSGKQFNDDSVLDIFAALENSLGVRQLNLSKASLQRQHIEALINLFKVNQSIEEANLQELNLSSDDLVKLAKSLSTNRTLDFLNLNMSQNPSQEILQEFYSELEGNNDLRVVIWDERKQVSMLKAIAEDNDIASIHIGTFYRLQGKDEEAIQWLVETRPIGDYELGGICKAQKEYKDAFIYYDNSATKGCGLAQYKLVDYYRGDWRGDDAEDTVINIGLLLPEARLSKREAFERCQQAANKGVVEALYRLGRMYEEKGGSGSGHDYVKKRSDDEAIKHFEEAANRGHQRAIECLFAIHNHRASKSKEGSETYNSFTQEAEFWKGMLQDYSFRVASFERELSRVVTERAQIQNNATDEPVPKKKSSKKAKTGKWFSKKSSKKPKDSKFEKK